jgi:hypothetical protein
MHRRYTVGEEVERREEEARAADRANSWRDWRAGIVLTGTAMQQRDASTAKNECSSRMIISD